MPGGIRSGIDLVGRLVLKSRPR